MKSHFNFNAEAIGTLPGGEVHAIAPECDVALADLPPGSTGVIIGVGDDGPVGHRLLDLGFLPGTRVEVMRRAPLGDPVVYELRGYQLCLRHAEACLVRVRVEGPTAVASG